MRNRFFVLLITAVVAAFTVGCGDDDPTPQARLRIVHASPDAPNVDVFVDGNRVLQGVTYKANSDYLSVNAGQRRIEVRPTGSNTSVINATPNLSANTDYTVLAVDYVASIAPLLLTDNNTAPASGQVKVRIVHASPIAGPVDIYVTAPSGDLATATPTLANVPFKAVSDYLSVAAGDYRVRVTPTGTKIVALDTGTLSLAAGQVRTAIAVDAPGGGGPVGVILLADRN